MSTASCDEYLASKAVRFVAAVEMSKGLPAYKRLSLEELHAAAEGLNLYAPIPEVIPAFTKPKSGGVRVVCDCGPRYRTGHRLVTNLLKPHFLLRPFQYDRKGSFGVHRAVLDLVALIEQGYNYVEHLDAKSFFGSFRADKLIPELPLPKAVVECVVLGTHAKIKIAKKATYPWAINHNNKLIEKARLGLLQGAASSPLVGAMMVSRLNWTAPTDVVLISFVDDFYLVAKTASALKDAAIALRAAFEALPGGQFTLRTKGAARHVSDGVNLFGHCVTAIGSKIVIELTLANETAADERFEALEKHAQLFAGQYVKSPTEKWRALALDAIGRLLGSAAAWAEAFALCVGIEDNLKIVQNSAFKAAWRQIMTAAKRHA
ncbi:MAG: reverse transcriptase domain-containing protein [Terriglobia bacterium]|nr:reverse transcriptase domain-containing protein [Terriglobia bacterium]